MQFLFEFFPIVLFVIAFKLKGIYAATAAAMIATIIQISIMWIWKRKVEKKLIVSLVIILLFGGLTLAFRNELFIKWKPSILYCIFAGSLFVSQQFFQKNIIKAMMEKMVQAPDIIWARLNILWMTFFCIMAVVNLFVAYQFSTQIWVYFKLVGGIGAMLVVAIIQSVMIYPYIDKESKAQ